MADLAEKILI